MANIFDSFRNLVSGLGTAKDKTTFTTATQFVALSTAEIDDLYRGSWLAQRMCDLPPGDMIKDWRTWQADAKFVTAVEAEEARLRVEERILECLRWRRQYGGAALILGFSDGTPDQPIDFATVKQSDLLYLRAVPCTKLQAGEKITDAADPYFGRASSYTMRSANSEIVIHPSRVIPFRNIGGSDNSVWGDSVFDTVKSAIVHLGASLQSAAHAMQDANNDALTIPDLVDQVATQEGRDRVVERLTLGQMAKSMFSIMLIGGNETYERKALKLDGFDGLIDRFFMAASGASGVPLARLIGKQAGSLGTTGEGDLRTYYDDLLTSRRRDLLPQLAMLDVPLIRSATGGDKPAEAYFTFPPFMQPTPKELAEISKLKTEAIERLHATGLIPDEVLQPATIAMLAEDNLLPGIEQAWNEFGAGGGNDGDDNPADPTDP